MKKSLIPFVFFILTTGYTMLYAASSNSAPTDLLGEGDYASRQQTVVKLGMQFLASDSQERRNILTILHTILVNESDTRKKIDVILLLGSLVYANPSQDETQQVEDMLYNTITREQDTTVILLTVRALPEFGGEDKSIDALSIILSRKELLKQQPKLIPATLHSLGRMGQPAIPHLVNAISDFPEAAMRALTATRDQRALQLLTEFRKSDNPAYRVHAVNALALWRASKDISPEEKEIIDRELSTATRDKDQSVRGVALEKLKELNE